METPQNTPNRPLAPVTSTLLSAIRAYRGNASPPKLTGEPIEFRWNEPTVPEEIHPDDWIDPLPIRPKRLPSRYKLFRMSRARRAAVLILHIVAADLEMEAVHRCRFHLTCDAEERRKMARNARRRKTRAIDRALEFGLWKNGRWQIGSLWTIVNNL